MSSASLTLVVDLAQPPERMDAWLSGAHPGLSRRHAQQLCSAGRVLQNGRISKKSDAVIPGATVTILGELSGAALPFLGQSLEFVRITEDYVAVNKPAGLPCAALRGKKEGTLAGALIAQFPDMQQVGHGGLDPGLVHRLDTYTSGLVLAARNQRAFTELKSSLTHKGWDKRYLGVVTARSLPDVGDCHAPLGPDPKNHRRVTVDPRRGHPCSTSFRVIERGARFDLVEVSVASAYRHQVRAHLALLHAPLIGDVLYGGPDCGLSPRHALHASYIAIEALGVAPLMCPLPGDLRTFSGVG